MKTALTELIERLESWKYDPNDVEFEEGQDDAHNEAIDKAINIATELLEKEREQIEKAFDSDEHDLCGCGECDFCLEVTDNLPITGEQYYNETFKQ